MASLEKFEFYPSSTIKLPGRCTQRTINRLQLTIPIHINYNGTNALHITEGKAPFNIDSKNRITRRLLREHRPVICKPNPFIIAQKYQKLYEQMRSMTAIGQQFGVSRIRIHQMLKLLKLDQRIINYIQNITNPRQSNFWNEHRLRSISVLPKEKQYDKFRRILNRI